MPKVSPLRMLIGSSPRGGAKHNPGSGHTDRDHLLEHELPSSHHQETGPSSSATPRGKKGSSMSFASVFPHSENVPENLLITPEKRPKGKFSWYQRQVKNLGAESEPASHRPQQPGIPKNPHQSTHKAGTPRSSKPEKDSHSTAGSSNDAATPRKIISKSLKYGSSTPQRAGHNSSKVFNSAAVHPDCQPVFDLEEDSSFWLEHSVQVLIRIRPLSSHEIAAEGYDTCIRQDSAHSLTWLGNPDTRFTFDHVACEAITQDKLFRIAGMPMVENCMRGYNSCVFAYGQTGSGKTHTMLGDITSKDSENRGLILRAFEHLFSTIRKEEQGRKDENLRYTCRCSFLEIYNEQITDLLEPSSTNLQVREDARKGVYVESLSEFEVNCLKDVTQLLLQGASNRKVAATNMNRESSRSHSVLTCVIESTWEREAVINRRYGRLNLVDLAGSERQKSSGAENDRLKEAVNINKSLSTLGLVIMVLVDVANGKQRHVPYRDSKLTYLLQDSLGGNSKTMIISTVSPSICCSLDTLSTLKFAQRAKFICNNAVVNEDTSRDVNVLRQQIYKLKEEVNRLRSQSSGTCTSPSSEDCDADNVLSSEHRKRCTPKRRRDINTLLSAEFLKLNQLRESLEAELELKPCQNDSYQRKLQEYQLENENLRRQIAELEAASCPPQEKNEEKTREHLKEIELLELKHQKSMTHLETLLKESEESRIAQATRIRNLEDCSKNYCSEIEELKKQLKEAREVQEQMESQQLFLISEFETVLEEHNKLSEKLTKSQAREQKAKDQLRLVNWEVKKKNELHDLERELEIRASAETLVGYVDDEEKQVLEAKLQKTRRELEDARMRNQLFQGEEALRLAHEKEMEDTRSEVEAETANAIASMNQELAKAREECKTANDQVACLVEELENSKLKSDSLTEENSRLARAYDSLLQERDTEVREIKEQCEDATSKVFDFLAEGDQALVAAAKEMEDIIRESFHGKSMEVSKQYSPHIGALQDKLHQALCVAKEAEQKMKSISDHQKEQVSEADQLKVQVDAYQQQLREAEKKAYVAFVVVRELTRNYILASRGNSVEVDKSKENDWRLEKEELLVELTEAKLEAAAKSKETATILQKFKDSQHMLQEAEQLLNALVKANEIAKSGAHGDVRRSVSEVAAIPERALSCKLDKAKNDLQVIKQEIGTITCDTVDAITDAEHEVQTTMQAIQDNLTDIMSTVFSFGDDVRGEFVELRDKMYEMMDETDLLIGEIRRKNELVKGLEYDISLLQEAFSEAHEKKIELQDENNRMQEELDIKTNEINGAEAELLKLLKTLTSVENELRTLKETTGYLSTENRSQKRLIEELELKNTRLEEDLEDKRHLIQSLDSELLDMSSLVERKVLQSQGDFDSGVLLLERDELHAELCKVKEQLEKARFAMDELEMVAEKSRKVAEECQVLSTDKEEEVKVLERSVQELESTIATMENQIGLIKRDGEMQKIMKEDMEMEVQRLRAELSRTKMLVQATDYSDISADKIKLLRLDEELENFRQEGLLKDVQINSLRKHVSELMDTATKEASAYRRKIKRLEASLETRCMPKPCQRAPEKACVKAKGSGSPFKCIGLGVSNEEHSTNKRRIEELEAAATVREKEVFMLNTKLAQAESMTYDVVRDLLEVKHDIASFAHVHPDEV
ncbi:kinesin-like protein KIN-12E [Selaginella moellendorffii]|uniref:kinesin-like protein KIN-12E n=1 Tax=Selaginella moellendorffii TaxID=88036 RepID=UPI000D1CC998|nr:kinesin-like protein KIN-12E [Selaginella moellendorffii]|eukprot:XP_024518825.1 kinesin-like protein KIN-12E [Selaginella moellendorffii]